MPSRHTACAFIIAMAFMYVSIPLGIAYLIISAFIMISRVLAGVHFISDVIAGMAISLLYGYFHFYNLNNRKAVAIQIRLQLLLL